MILVCQKKMNTLKNTQKQKRKFLFSPLKITVISEPIDVDLEFQKINSYHNRCVNKAKTRRVSSPGIVKSHSPLTISEEFENKMEFADVADLEVMDILRNSKDMNDETPRNHHKTHFVNRKSERRKCSCNMFEHFEEDN